MKYTIAKMKNWKEKYVSPENINQLEPWTVLKTREVRPWEYEKLGIPVYVSLSVKKKLYKENDIIKNKIAEIQTFFSEVKREMKNWILSLSNIKVENVSEILNKKEYKELKWLWVEFDDHIKFLFKDVILWNITEDGKKKIYHTPKSEWYDELKYSKERGDMVFDTKEEAEKEGFKPKKAEKSEKSDKGSEKTSDPKI